MLQIIAGHLTSAYALNSSSLTYILAKKASITTTSPDALFQAPGVSDDHIVIRGLIQGGQAPLDSGLTLHGNDTTVKVAKSGVIEASTGIELGAGDVSVTNYGDIAATGFGIWAQSTAEVRNFGRIFGGSDGFICGGGGATSVFNAEGGRIHSDIAAVKFQGGYGTESHLTNEGRIAGSWALVATFGDETVINHGVMKGLILMGEGNDRFDNRGGKVDHDISGQIGNDTLITDSAHVHLAEVTGQGIDTVRSTVSYTLNADVEALVLLGKANLRGTGTGSDNLLTGNKGENRLLGHGGSDTLDGVGGNDVMTGGAGGDIFIFAKGGAHDTITDFVSLVDDIDLSGQNVINDYFDMIFNYVRSSHGDLVIHLGKDTLTLQDTKAADLDVNDFSF